MKKRKTTPKKNPQSNPASAPAFALQYGTGATMPLGMARNGQEAELMAINAGLMTCDQPTWVGDAWQITVR